MYESDRSTPTTTHNVSKSGRYSQIKIVANVERVFDVVYNKVLILAFLILDNHFP